MDPLGSARPPASFRALMAYEDEAFVAAAYQAILGRLPGPGETSWVEDLRRGARKTAILAGLRDSAEGRARGAQIEGLESHERVEALRRIPVFGTVLSLILDALNRPALTDQIVTSHRHVRHNGQLLEESRQGLRQVRETLAQMQEGYLSLAETLRLEHRRAVLDREVMRQLKHSLSRLEQNTIRVDKVEEAVANMSVELSSLIDVRHQRLQAQMAEWAGSTLASSIARDLPAGGLVVVSGSDTGGFAQSLERQGVRVGTSVDASDPADLICHFGPFAGEDIARFKQTLKPGTGKLLFLSPV